MEFGIFVQGHVPKARTDREGRDAEHNALMADMELIKAADQYGWKYVWVAEHHFLNEYSHMLGQRHRTSPYAAAVTKRIHVGSGIFSLNPHKESPGPRRRARGDARPSQRGRFEFGTAAGRRAPSSRGSTSIRRAHPAM